MPNNFEHFTPRFFRPPHLRKVSLRQESAHASNSVSSAFEGRTNGHVQKLSQEERVKLMDLLRDVPSMAPVIAMMLDHAPDKGRTIRNQWPKLERNEPCDITGVKSKHCMCIACTEEFGVTGEKWDKFEDRELNAQLMDKMGEKLEALIAQIDRISEQTEASISEEAKYCSKRNEA